MLFLKKKALAEVNPIEGRRIFAFVFAFVHAFSEKKHFAEVPPHRRQRVKKAGQYLYFKKMKQENKKMSNFSITLGTFSITVSDVKRRWDKKLNRNVLHANVQCSEEGKELMLCINGEYLLLPNATEGTESKDIQRDPQCEKNDCVSVTRGDEENKDELAKKYFWVVVGEKFCPLEMRKAFEGYPYIEPRMGKYWRKLRDEGYLDENFKPLKEKDGGKWTGSVGKYVVKSFCDANEGDSKKEEDKTNVYKWAPFEEYWGTEKTPLRTRNNLKEERKTEPIDKIFGVAKCNIFEKKEKK